MEEYESLMIEVTRKCNFSCGHCLRGESQNKDLDPENLRSFLKESKQKFFFDLIFTGGEPFLKVDLMNKLLDIFEEEKFIFSSYFIATNGSLFNSKTLSFIKRLHSFCRDNDSSKIEISDSPYHKTERIKLGFNQSVDDLINDAKKSDIFFENIQLLKDNKTYETLIEQGKSISGVKPNKRDLLVYLNANGKVIEGYCNLSFDNQDIL